MTMYKTFRAVLFAGVILAPAFAVAQVDSSLGSTQLTFQQICTAQDQEALNFAESADPADSVTVTYVKRSTQGATTLDITLAVTYSNDEVQTFIVPTEAFKGEIYYRYRMQRRLDVTGYSTRHNEEQKARYVTTADKSSAVLTLDGADYTLSCVLRK